jgi:hypothetical protein
MNTCLNKLHHYWEQLWFKPTSANNLGFIRILLAFYFLWKLLSREFFTYISFPPEIYLPETSLTGIAYFYACLARPGLFLLGMEYGLYLLYMAIAILSFVLAMIGLKGRFFCFLGALLTFPLLTLEYAAGGVIHQSHELGLLFVFILSFSHSSDALSVDKYLRDNQWVSNVRSWKYSWPIRMMQLSVCLIYFFTGITKLIHIGFAEFVSAVNMVKITYWITQSRVGVLDQVPAFLLQHTWLLIPLAFYTIVLETGFPLAFFWPRSKNFFIFSAIGFHTAIFVAYSLVFLDLFFFYPVFYDWNAIAEKLGVKQKGKIHQEAVLGAQRQ